MQPKTQTVRPPLTLLRWFARALGIAWIVLYGGFELSMVSGNITALDARQYLILGLIGVGVLVAIFWPGIGEVIGGLACVGSATAVIAIYPWLGLLAAAPFALVGLLFIICGWYALARERRVAHTTA